MRFGIARQLLALSCLVIGFVGARAQENYEAIAIINSSYNNEWAVAPDSIAAIFGRFTTINQEFYGAD
ncbi:MAG: hypothetical protein HOP19_03790, partial [Acidobacteria bacterium]|nr:hypothetical protein [Acidobacteriota bacterium]